MLAAAPLSAIDHWRKTPFLNLQEEGYEPVPCDQVDEALPSFNPGRNTSAGPVLYSNGETLAVVKTYDGKKGNSVLREKIAADIVQSLNGCTAPFRVIAMPKRGLTIGASLVMDPAAQRLTASDCDQTTVARSYYAQMVINDLDFLLDKHTLKSDTHGITHFDFRAPPMALLKFSKVAEDFQRAGLGLRTGAFYNQVVRSARGTSSSSLANAFSAVADDLKLTGAARKTAVHICDQSLKRLDFLQTGLHAPWPERVYIGDEEPLKRLARLRRETVATLKDKIGGKKTPQPEPTFGGVLARF